MVRIPKGEGDRPITIEGDERRMMEAVFLYQVYHRFVAELDRLIARQLQRRAHQVQVQAGHRQALQQFGMLGDAAEVALRQAAR